MTEIFSNIVPQDKLQEQTLGTLKIISDSLMTSFGPFGSATQIKKGDVLSKFTKDGHTILKNINFNGFIEMSIKEVLEDVTKHVVKEVGDGTTSAVVLSELIYRRLATKIEPNIKTDEANYHLNAAPAEIEKALIKVTDKIKEIILKNKREIKTYGDIMKIALISTNNNEEMSRLISEVYMNNGNDVYIDVKRSNTSDDYIKIFDGMTIGSGYADKAYINNDSEATCEINNPRVYFFEDPIDTHQMINFLGKIITNNIVKPINEKSEIIPTVIVAPKVSNDASVVIDPLVKSMYNAKANGFKIPFLMITNTRHQDMIMDLANLCDAKTIRKFIDPTQEEAAQKTGDAPSEENVQDWYGRCDAIVSDFNKSKFINPVLMYKDGTTEFSDYYKTIIGNLQVQLDNAKKQGKDINFIGNLRRRIHSMSANMVDLYIGGDTPEERDNRFDLAEDAVLNCMSAAVNGYGYGSNLESCIALRKLNDTFSDKLEREIYLIIFNSYLDLLAKLYSTRTGTSVDCFENASDEVKLLIEGALNNKIPFDVRKGQYSEDVISSIMSDITVLKIVAKVVGMLVTTKQYLCPTPQHNIYK